MLLGRNGGVSWAEQFIPSGVAALVVAATPMWMVLLDWLRPGGGRLSGAVWAGLAVGVAVLVGPESLGGAPVDPVGAAAAAFASFCWALGYSRLSVSVVLANTHAKASPPSTTVQEKSVTLGSVMSTTRSGSS